MCLYDFDPNYVLETLPKMSPIIDPNLFLFEELEQADDLNAHFMNIIYDHQPNIFINSNERPLIDDVKEVSINDEIFEEESAEFEGFNREYRLYFPNFTSIVIYSWIIKHKIIHQHDVPIYKQKAPSTLASTKKAFTISPLVHLECVLNNPTIMPDLYFRPGVVREEKNELWHENLWQDSPLFGEHTISCNNRVNNELDNNSRLKVDMLLSIQNLLNCQSDSDRHTRGDGRELWLIEGDSTYADPKSISYRIIRYFQEAPVAL
ncbi:12034_t:CDS:2 [Cetraspora pellucida]|uniref:12034_t:CDS:1 n=1 Tax=Cetraspora pellucida TaxID=1433469 RepID=A0ACA9KZ14_9GLOM|nr:12034_t:CDS:2 [Cetraspora pellucida]